MSTRILYDPEQGSAALYDSVTGVAFGEIFDAADDGTPADDMAREFVEYVQGLGHDLRGLDPRTLAGIRERWLMAVADRDAQVETSSDRSRG
jgi:hypothetical protein